MADNTGLSTAVGDGDDIRTKDRAGIKTPISLIDVGGTSGSEAVVGDSGVAMPVRGLAAEDAAASGNPVPAGGRYDSSPRSLEDGDRGEIALTAAGHQYTEVSASALPSGAATSAKQDTAAAILTTIDADTGALAGCVGGTELQVDIVSGAVTVSGSVTANAGTNLNTSALALESGGNLAACATSLGTLDNAIAGNEMQVDIVSSAAIPVTDNTGSLTVDAPVGTPVFVRLSDGSSAITTLPVSLASVPSHAVTNAGTFATQVDGAALTALQLIDNPVVVDDAAFTPATTSVMMAGFQADESSTDSVNEGDAGAARITLDRKQIVTVQPHTAGGVSTFKSNDIDETEEDVKTSAGQVYFIYCVNTNASARYLKLYNATAANVTVGSTATKMDLLVPPSNSGFYLQFPTGIVFDTAISVAATTGLGDSDSGAPGASEVQVTIGYV